MSVNEAVLAKLAKILALANDKAATQGEIEAAMSKAKAIAVQNNIELSTVDFDLNNKAKANTIEITKDGTLKLGVAFVRKYHSWIWHICQEVFGVRFITSRYKQGSRERCSAMWIVGEVTDVAIAKVIFTWLEDLFPKSFNAAVRTGQLPNNAAAAHGYYRGLAHGILEVNKKAEEQMKSSAAGNKYAMVVRSKDTAIQAHMEQEFPDLRQQKAKSVRLDYGAAELGAAAGRRINLSQLGGGKAAGQLN